MIFNINRGKGWAKDQVMYISCAGVSFDFI